MFSIIKDCSNLKTEKTGHKVAQLIDQKDPTRERDSCVAQLRLVTCVLRRNGARDIVGHTCAHKSTVIIDVTQVSGVRVQCGTGLKRQAT